MNADFWFQKWEKNKIGFHESEVNPLLIKYFKELSLELRSRVFVPLCGKTLDITWLLSQGYHVAGVELSEMAIKQLFINLMMQPTISIVGKLKRYSADNIDIFVGDIFDLSATILGPVDAIYDRAALVALPKEIRNRYTAHLPTITDSAPQLLLCYEYDQTLMQGPPFSINKEEIISQYEERYELSHKESKYVSGGLNGKCAAKENIWLMQ